MLIPEYSKKIRDLRLSLGMTREQFAVRLGVSMSSVIRWETGRGEPAQLAQKMINQLSDQKGDKS